MKNKQPLFSDKIIAIYDAWMRNKRLIQKYRVNMFIKSKSVKNVDTLIY